MVTRSVSMLFAALVVLATAVWPSQARAWDVIWCWNDPTLLVGGTVVHIDLGVPQGQRNLIRGSTLVVIVPSNVQARLVGDGIKNFPLDVSLVAGVPYGGDGPIPITAIGAVVNGVGTPTRMRVWQPAKGKIASVGGIAPLPMATQFTVERRR